MLQPRALLLVPLLAACWAGGVPTVGTVPASERGPAAPQRADDTRISVSRPEGARTAPTRADAARDRGSGGDLVPLSRSALTEVEALREMQLMVPVHGIRPDQIPDTYWAKRDGNRLHRASDIMAPRGTPIVAPTEGTVLRIGRNVTGGIVVYATDAERRFVFYFAHLDRVAERLRDGDEVAQGTVLGYVGTTGNAPPNAPHLHFQVMRMPNDTRYWEGMPVDVRPFLVRNGSHK